jgi:hypothetical protein
MMRARVPLWLAPLPIALVLLAVPLPAGLVEDVFATTWYPRWQRTATTLTNLVPLAAFDLLVVVAAAALVAAVRRGIVRTRGRRPAGRVIAVCVSVLLVAAWAYLWFLASWGLNYSRVPIEVRLAIDRASATPDAARRLAVRTVDELNHLHADAWRQAWPTRDAWRPVLATALAGTQRQLRSAWMPVPGRPKISLLQPYFRWAGIDGVTNPFLPEILVNADALPIEQPMIVAHEWGHLAGLAHEADASFAAWVLCQRTSVQSRYSAWLWITGHVLAAVPAPERRLLVARLEAGPRRDLAAIAARNAQIVPAVRVAAWTAYDRYLKSNAVREGVASYDAALTLVLASPDVIPAAAGRHD